MSNPSLSVIKTLFAVSCNVCAYPQCEEKLCDPSWSQVNADICHIAGARPTSPRYDETMTEAMRHGYENLILLCPNHHRLIDRLEPHGHSTPQLQQIKADAEKGCTNPEWTTDEELTKYALAALADGAIARDETGLSDHSLRALTLLAEEAISADHGKTAVNLRNELVTNGYPPLSVTLALRDLERSGLVERRTEEDHDGDPYDVVYASEAGLSYLEANTPTSKLARQERKATANQATPAANYNYDEEPF